MSYPQASSAYNNGHYSYIPSNAPTQNKYVTQQGTELVPKTQRRSSPYDPLNDSDPFASIGLYVVPPTQPSPEYLTSGRPAHNSSSSDAHTSQHHVSSAPYYPLPPGYSSQLQHEPSSSARGPLSQHSPLREAVRLTAEDYDKANLRSQPAMQDEGVSRRARCQEHPRPPKPARHSKLDGIPKGQMQRIRLENLGSSSSGMKRTRYSDSGDAHHRLANSKASFHSDLAGGRKAGSGSKAVLTLEDEKELQEKRRREAERVQTYRGGVTRAIDGLHLETYPNEHESGSARSERGRQKCVEDATELIRTLRKEKAACEKEIQQLISAKNAMEAALTTDVQQCQQEIMQLRQVVAHLQRRLQ